LDLANSEITEKERDVKGTKFIMTTAHRYAPIVYCETDELDPHSIQQEEETRIKLLHEHSTLKLSLPIRNSNSDIKDKHPNLKSHNEIFELNFSELKLSIDERPEREEQLKMRRMRTTQIEG
jgi:hypothetical protein